MIGFLALAGFGLIRAIASARIANFGSNAGSLAIYALSGNIAVAPGLAMGLGCFLGARVGAHSALRAGAGLVRPLIVLMSCAMALRLATLPGAPLRLWFEIFRAARLRRLTAPAETLISAPQSAGLKTRPHWV